MNKNEKEHIIETLVNVYNMDIAEVNTWSNEDLQQKLKSLQQEKISLAKNPNKFWYIKGLPVPPDHKTTTSSKWGAIVILVLFLTLAGFLGLFLYMAYSR